MPESFRLRERVAYVAAFLLTVMLILLLEFLGVFQAVNWQTYDLFFRFREEPGAAREHNNSGYRPANPRRAG